MNRVKNATMYISWGCVAEDMVGCVDEYISSLSQ
jgi:hypothetical protein